MKSTFLFYAFLITTSLSAQQFTGSANTSGVVTRYGAISLPTTSKGVIFNTSEANVDATWGGHFYGLSKGDPQKINLSTSGYGKLHPVLGGFYGVGIRSQNGTFALLQNGIATIGVDQAKIDDLNDSSVATNDPYRLYVAGGIRTEDVMIDLEVDWADYVFSSDYELINLDELELFIDKNKHLPNMPSSQEISDTGGFNLKEITLKQQEKIEELTLYILELNKQMQQLIIETKNQ